MIRLDRARRLKPVLEALLDPAAMARRVEVDPVRFPRRYPRPADAEVVALVSACLAYGRADLFGQRLEELWRRVGERPSELARNLEPRRDRALFSGISYRFNSPADLAALLGAAGTVQRESGSLGAAFAESFNEAQDLRAALSAFAGRLRRSVPQKVEAALGPMRGFDHLLPEPNRGGACKRLLLLLRWLVRGGPADPIDLGLWKGVPTSALLVPLDTHVARIALNLGLTRRRDLSWATAQDVTASLRQLDPEDPVRYDFALCHHGMSGACPRRRSAEACGPCALAPHCRWLADP
ncbi:MAG TPA: TIGR02757 family protein [Myxococcales bacterium]|jgi:uncharacterized protein (TIGR02757 family)